MGVASVSARARFQTRCVRMAVACRPCLGCIRRTPPDIAVCSSKLRAWQGRRSDPPRLNRQAQRQCESQDRPGRKAHTGRIGNAASPLWLLRSALSTPSAAKVPERSRQSQRREQRLDVLDRRPPPLWRAAVGSEPGAGQPPGLFERQHRTRRQSPLRAPSIDVLFSPEEQHRFSREDDVVPPPGRGYGEVDDVVALRRTIGMNVERHRVAAAGTGGADAAGDSHHHRHAECIPRAVGVGRVAMWSRRETASAPPRMAAPSAVRRLKAARTIFSPPTGVPGRSPTSARRLRPVATARSAIAGGVTAPRG